MNMGRFSFASHTILILAIIIEATGQTQPNEPNTAQTEQFFEELLVRPLADGKIMTHFQFTTRWAPNREDPSTIQHYQLFPKSLGQVIGKFTVEELHMTFTQGRWFSSRWGSYPVLPAPVGLEAYVRFSEKNGETSQQAKKRVDTLWEGLTNTLSGLFCGSLEQLGATVTSVPRYSFAPEGATQKYYGENITSHTLRYGILPRENVCTENLTPWLKMLPCRNKAGLAAILNSLRIYDVQYHSMGTHVRPICSDEKCSSSVLELIQSLTIVFEPNSPKYNILSLFERKELSACPLATESLVYVQDTPPYFDYEWTIDPSPTRKEKSYSVYDLKKFKQPLDLKVTTKPRKPTAANPTQISAQRYSTGYGQEYGGIAVHITNGGPENIPITYFEMIPWYLRVYFHTFELYSQDDLVFDKFLVTPSEYKSSPSVIEFSCTIPANSSISFTVHFEKAFLHFTEHLPDANRGLDIGSAVVTASYPSGHKDMQFVGYEWSPTLYKQKIPTSLRIYTEGILVSLPTPDFSMPYNVITLTGTVFAMFFGSVYHLLLRRMRYLDRIGNEFVSKRPAQKLLRRLLKFVDGE